MKHKRFKISELAKFFGVHRNTISRYLKIYEKENGLDLRDGQTALECLFWLKNTITIVPKKNEET